MSLQTHTHTAPISAHDLWQDVLAVRASAPLVHSITNFVVMNFNANVLLALGASPVMAHAREEVTDMANIAAALVLNIGTLEPDWIDAMKIAHTRAQARGIPVVLDPVGAGATPYRNQALTELIINAAPSIIRGNASEIMSVAGLATETRGVDSSVGSNQALDSAQALAYRINGVVCVSGETDYVLDAQGRLAQLNNGHVWMTKVTGVGCSASAMVGAFAAVQPDFWRATLAAMAYLGVVGEVAYESAKNHGVGTYQIQLLNTLQNLDEATFMQRLKLNTTQGVA